MNSITHSAAGLIRTLARRPGFALAVVLILALGIGANTATLSLLYRYFYAPLPYPTANHLVDVHFVFPNEGMLDAVSVPAYSALRTQAPALQNSALFQEGRGFNLLRGQNTLRVAGISCTASLFATLGVSPVLGRVFSRSSEAPGAQPVIVLSYRMWDEVLHRDPQVIGQTLHLNGRLYTVIGVMPRGFWFPSRSNLFWVPLTLAKKEYGLDYLGTVNYNMIGRLAPGAGLQQLNVQMHALLQQMVARIPSSEERAYFQSHHVQLLSQFWRIHLVGEFHQSLILMQLATALLILLAWFNLANLFVTRALARRGEMTIRRVLGVSTRRLFADLLVESLTLCAVGTALGLVLGHLMVILLQHSGLLSGGSVVPTQTWWPSIAVASGLGVLSSLVFAAAGFYFARHQDLSQALREGDARASHGSGERRTRAGLVVLQVALACGLSGMGLMLARSLLHLNAVDLGFQPQQVMTFEVDLPSSDYGPKQMVATLSQLREKLREVPGVSSAS
ncbi:MAG: ABC transporter permease, partial [Gammaproteobacteria bacterium]